MGAGIYRAFTTLGMPLATVTEEVGAPMPTAEEADIMSLDIGSPILVFDRLTRTVLEALMSRISGCSEVGLGGNSTLAAPVCMHSS